MKKLVSLLVCVALMLSCVCLTAFAADAPVAKVGDETFATVAEAVAAVEDGGEIQLLEGEITELVDLGRIDKSFTLVGAADHGTVFTAGLKIGTDNSSWPNIEATVTVKGIAFKNAGLAILDVRNVVVEDNKFEDIADTEPAAIRIVDPSLDGAEASTVVKNNYIDGTSQGIRIRAGYNIEISGNTIKNTQHNAITLEHASNWPANDGTVVIADNTIENWALSGEGRVIRAVFNATEENEKEISFTGNKMVRDEEPAEEYAKLTEVGAAEIELEKNYWNSDAPDFDKIVVVTGGTTEVEVTEYYKAETMNEEDLNTYVAPPADDEDEKEDDEKDNEGEKENTPVTDDKKTETTTKTDDKTTSPQTGDSVVALAALAISAAALVISARKVK